MNRFVALLVVMANFVFFSSSLVPNRKSSVIQSPLTIEVSPNERYAAAFNTTHFCVYNALTGGPLIIRQTDDPIVSMQFSWSSTRLALSDNQGTTELITINQSKVSSQIIRNSKPSKEGDEQSVIADTCWTAGDEFVVMVHTDGVIVASTFKGTIANGFFASGKPSKVTCSPDRPRQFAIGGTSKTANQIVLQHLTINQQKESIESQPISRGAVTLTRINYMKINKQNEVLVAGDSNTIYAYTPPDYNLTVYYSGEGQLFKFEFTNDGRIFAVINQTHLTVEDNIQTTLSASTIFYPTKSRLFSLALGGTRLVYLDQTGSAEYLSECAEGQFLNPTTSQCVKCNSTCSVCQAESNKCFECESGRYLSANTCLSCSQNCSQCTSATFCVKCMEPFIVRSGGVCGCQNGYRLVDNECKRGIEIWLFAVVVGGASLLLCLISVVNIFVMRKREKARLRSLLGGQSSGANDVYE